MKPGRELDKIVADDLIRLARLGLWAEQHGIPALKKYGSIEHWMSPSKEALAALPKDDALTSAPNPSN